MADSHLTAGGEQETIDLCNSPPATAESHTELSEEATQASEEGGDGKKQENTVRLRTNPVHEHFTYNSSTNKSTCKYCKSQLAGKNPTTLGKSA